MWTSGDRPCRATTDRWERLFFDRGPHGRVIGVPQHALDVVGVRSVDRLLVLRRQIFHSVVSGPLHLSIICRRAEAGQRT